MVAFVQVVQILYADMCHFVGAMSATLLAYLWPFVLKEVRQDMPSDPVCLSSSRLSPS